MDFMRYRERLRKRRAREAKKKRPTKEDVMAVLDRATRDLHAAASIALRMVMVARDDLRMPRL